MSNLTDSKNPIELNEEDLEQVTGGSSVNIVGGTYTAPCPFCTPVHTPFSKFFSRQKIDSADVVGTCEKCNAIVTFKNNTWAVFTSGSKSQEVKWNRTAM